MLACALRYFFFSFRVRTPLTCILLYYVSSNYYICVRILLHVCPHTTCVSSYYYIFVLRLLYVSSYYYVCVQLLICPHATICVLILLHVFSFWGMRAGIRIPFGHFAGGEGRDPKKGVCVCVSKKNVCVCMCVLMGGVCRRGVGGRRKALRERVMGRRKAPRERVCEDDGEFVGMH